MASAPCTAILGTAVRGGPGSSSKLTSCTASCFLKESRRSERCSLRMTTSSSAPRARRDASPSPSLSADWPRRSLGECAGAGPWPGSGDGERGGGGASGGQASGDGGMLLVDLRRPLLCRGGPSLAASPCRELGRVRPVAGEAGLLELGETLGGDAASAGDRDWSVPSWGRDLDRRPRPRRWLPPHSVLSLENSYACVKTKPHLPTPVRSLLCLFIVQPMSCLILKFWGPSTQGHYVTPHPQLAAAPY